MLKRLYIDGYRSLVNFEIEFGPLGLLAGVNGSGKSSVFDVLYSLSRFITGEERVSDCFQSSTLNRWRTNKAQIFEVDLEIGKALYNYRLVVKHLTSRDERRVTDESLRLYDACLFSSDGGQAQLYNDNTTKGPVVPFDSSLSGIGFLQPRDDNTKLTKFKETFGQLLLVRLSPSDMKSESQSEVRHPRPSMSDFASWLRFHSQEDMGLLVDLSNALREVFPGFDSFQLKEVGENSRSLYTSFLDDGGKRVSFAFGDLSDGQRSLVCVYTSLLMAKRNGTLLLLDEPDNFLALSEIQPLLIELSDATEDEKCQAIIASHHPEMLSYLDVNSGHWLWREPLGPTRVKPLAEIGVDGLTLGETVSRGLAE